MRVAVENSSVNDPVADLAADTSTLGVLVDGTTTRGIFELSGDKDWYRFEATAFEHLEFLASAESSSSESSISISFNIQLRVFDDEGNLVWAPGNVGSLRFVPERSGTYFVEASHSFKLFASEDIEVNGEYDIQYSVPEDDFITFGEAKVFQQAELLSSLGGSIETVGDVDVMLHKFLAGEQYSVTVHGSDSNAEATLENPVVRVYRLDEDRQLELVAGDNNGGEGRSARVQFTAPTSVDDNLFIMVDGLTGTGTYQVEVDATNDEAGFPNGRRLDVVTNWDSDKSLSGVLESVGDVDTFLLRAEQGKWYRVGTPGPASFRGFRVDVTSPSGTNVRKWPSRGIPIERNGLFYAEETGDYRVEVSSDTNLSVQEYSISVDARQPSFTQRDLISNAPLQTNELVTFVDNIAWESSSPGQISKYQVRGSHHLRNNRDGDELLAPRTVYEFDSDWSPNLIGVPSGQNGNGHLWTRGYDSVSQTWTAWRKTAVEDRPQDSNVENVPMLEIGTFAFADALPNHWNGVEGVSGFEPFTQAERDAFRQALEAWQIRRRDGSGKTLQEVTPGTSNNSAEIILFKSDTGGDVLVQPNEPVGRNRAAASDIVLPYNADWLSPDQLAPGNRGFFELLRAIGVVIGKPENGESKLESVMGDRELGPEGVWPAEPTARDLFRESNIIDKYWIYEIAPAESGSDFYRFNHRSELVETIFDRRGTDWLGGDHSGDFHINLRAGEQSGRWDGERLEFVKTIAFGTEIENASGGNRNDHLSGNRFSNNLLGLDGDDVLFGDSGDDRLYGGAGDDIYRFQLADDRDVINELGSGGIDTIEIHGFGTFDSLDDLSVRRMAGGDDLLIRLQLDGNTGHIQDSIRIRNMSDEASRVETLKLFWNDEQFATVSLSSLYEQATNENQRFQVASGSDDFGQLVRPI